MRRRYFVRLAVVGAVVAGAVELAGLVSAPVRADGPAYFSAGDLSVGAAMSSGGELEFWGAQWAKDNNVSSGAGPDSFKGYVDTVTFTNPCSGTFTASPGNSSGPPASLADPVDVLVVDSVTKDGDVISGTFTDVVTVAPDSGYQDDPGHAGTGVIVGRCRGTTSG